MNEEPLPLWSRVAVFVAFEGFLAWRLVIGLLKRQFEVGDEHGVSVATRREHPVRYWCWVAVLAATMAGIAWLFRDGVMHPASGAKP